LRNAGISPGRLSGDLTLRDDSPASYTREGNLLEGQPWLKAITIGLRLRNRLIQTSRVRLVRLIYVRLASSRPIQGLSDLPNLLSALFRTALRSPGVCPVATLRFSQTFQSAKKRTARRKDLCFSARRMLCQNLPPVPPLVRRLPTRLRMLNGAPEEYPARHRRPRRFRMPIIPQTHRQHLHHLLPSLSAIGTSLSGVTLTARWRKARGRLRELRPLKKPNLHRQVLKNIFHVA
jgi:hypothetical protein